MAGNYRSGRHAKTAAQRAVDGSRQRARHRAAPRYAHTIPTCPAHVSEDPLARLAWERLTAALDEAGVVDASHAEALAALADTWADYQRVRAEMRELGYRTLIPRTRVGLDGSTTEELVVNPLRRTTLELAKELRAWLAEFGLTPITVAKVARRETAQPDDDPLAAFLAPATRASQIRRVK